MDYQTKSNKTFLIVVIIVILVFVACTAMYAYKAIQAIQAEGKLQTIGKELEDIIIKQRNAANQYPEDIALKRLDFLDIVEKEMEYNQALSQKLDANSLKAEYLAAAVFLVASLLVFFTYSPGVVKESFKEFKGWFKKRNPKNRQGYRNQGQQKRGSKKVIMS